MYKTIYTTLFILILVLLAYQSFSQVPNTVVGNASYYADRFHGRKTASGEKYLKNQLTAAHKNLPFGTIVKVTNLNNGQTVEVKINDRGPYSKKCIIDLSKEAAKRLDILTQGIAEVHLEYVLPGSCYKQDTIQRVEPKGFSNVGLRTIQSQ